MSKVQTSMSQFFRRSQPVEIHLKKSLTDEYSPLLLLLLLNLLHSHHPSLSSPIPIIPHHPLLPSVSPSPTPPPVPPSSATSSTHIPSTAVPVPPPLPYHYPAAHHHHHYQHSHSSNVLSPNCFSGPGVVVVDGEEFYRLQVLS